METTADARKKVTIRELKTEVKAAVDVPGWMDILENGNVILSCWPWEISAILKKDARNSRIVFKGDQNWHVDVSAPVSEVRTALATATALWESHSAQNRKNNR